MIGIRDSKLSGSMLSSALALAGAVVVAAIVGTVLALQGRAVGHPPALAAGVVSMGAGLALVGLSQAGNARLFLWVSAAVLPAAFFLASTL